ncbi:hypothetical protein GEMRC1_002063 [Eukaryota sp. GEM-RC1]
MPSEAALQIFEQTLTDIREAGTWKNERVIVCPQSGEVFVKGSDTPVINMCANNYLGLSNNEEIKNAAIEMIKERGFGLSSVRFICGTQDIHKQLERTISDFYGTEDCILYSSCFDANTGLFETLLHKDDAIISANLNHASIIDGVRLTKCQRLRYQYNDMDDLRAKLEEAKDARIRLITTDSTFSMDGEVAPLDKIYELAKEYDALIHIDECHSSGFIGPTGRGVPELFNLHGKIDIVTSTLGKALGGSQAGFTASSRAVVDLLRQKSRPYLFSNSVSPGIVGGSLKVFELLNSSSNLIDQIRKNTRLFRSRMNEAGFEVVGNPEHPICPVMLYDAKLAAQFADEMLQRGIYVIAFSFPVVPKEKARIRTQMSAAHTEDEVNRCVEAFIEVGKSSKSFSNFL